MLGIMAGMIQKDFSVVKVINIPVVAQRLFHMVQTVLRKTAILQLRVDKMVDVLVVVVKVNNTPFVAQRPFPTVRLFSKS